MIKVVCGKNLYKITISGHADFANIGQDIVCASVSSIVTTTINGILAIDPQAIKYIKGKDKICIDLQKDTETTRILLNNMLNLLQELEQNYPKNIKIS